LPVRELCSPEEISRGALSSGTKPATQESADGVQANEKPIRQCSKSSLRFTVGRRGFMKKLLFGLRRLGLLLVELLRYIVMLPVGKVPPEGWT